MTISIEKINSLVNSISQLGKQLPESVPEGTRQDKLYTVLKNINEGNISITALVFYLERISMMNMVDFIIYTVDMTK